MSDTDLAEKVRAKLNELRANLQAHGGDLEFVEMQDSVVKLRLKGACSGCPHAAITIKQGIERTLKAEVDPSLSVEPV